MSVKVRYAKKGYPTKRKWYYTDFQHEGVRYTSPESYPTKGEAKKWEEEMRRKLRQGLVRQIPSDRSFGESFREYMAHCKAVGQTEKWRKDRAYVISAFYSDWANLPLFKITKAMAMKKLDWRASTVSGYSANNDRKILLTAWDWFKDMEWVYTNPFQEIRRYPETKKYPAEPFTLEEFNRLLAVADGKQRAYLMVLRLSGSRPGQINRLRWDRVEMSDTRDKSFFLRYTRKTRDGSIKWDRVDMGPGLYEVFKYLQSQRKPEHEFVFCDDWGNPFGDRRRMFHHLCEKAGVKYRKLYNIRHGSASLAFERGGTLQEIQGLLGHANPNVTHRYLHRMGFSRNRVFDLLDDAKYSERQKNAKTNANS